MGGLNGGKVGVLRRRVSSGRGQLADMKWVTENPRKHGSRTFFHSDSVFRPFEVERSPATMPHLGVPPLSARPDGNHVILDRQLSLSSGHPDELLPIRKAVRQRRLAEPSGYGDRAKVRSK